MNKKKVNLVGLLLLLLGFIVLGIAMATISLTGLLIYLAIALFYIGSSLCS